MDNLDANDLLKEDDILTKIQQQTLIVDKLNEKSADLVSKLEHDEDLLKQLDTYQVKMEQIKSTLNKDNVDKINNEYNKYCEEKHKKMKVKRVLSYSLIVLTTTCFYGVPLSLITKIFVHSPIINYILLGTLTGAVVSVALLATFLKLDKEDPEVIRKFVLTDLIDEYGNNDNVLDKIKALENRKDKLNGSITVLNQQLELVKTEASRVNTELVNNYKRLEEKSSIDDCKLKEKIIIPSEDANKVYIKIN
ncbi:MAG: hypothetical protein RSA48_01240 [Bacilli bacterium]